MTNNLKSVHLFLLFSVNNLVFPNSNLNWTGPMVLLHHLPVMLIIYLYTSIITFIN